jgi:hypothetical protein
MIKQAEPISPMHRFPEMRLAQHREVSDDLDHKRDVITQFFVRRGLSPVLMPLPGYALSLGGGGMSSQRYSPKFKDEAKHQIVDSGYSVADVSERLGVSDFPDWSSVHRDAAACPGILSSRAGTTRCHSN